MIEAAEVPGQGPVVVVVPDEFDGQGVPVGVGSGELLDDGFEFEEAWRRVGEDPGILGLGSAIRIVC